MRPVIVGEAPSFYSFTCPFYSLVREINIDRKMSPLKLYLALIMQSPNVRA